MLKQHDQVKNRGVSFKRSWGGSLVRSSGVNFKRSSGVYLDGISTLNEIKPKEVMIYTVDREAPVKELEKVSTEKLNEICELVNKQGIKANVYL